jgi:hypothetical protein
MVKEPPQVLEEGLHLEPYPPHIRRKETQEAPDTYKTEKYMSEINGYDLFDDIDDVVVRTHNRAAVIMNMFPGKTGTAEQLSKALNYLKALPDGERHPVVQKLAENWSV